MPEPDPRLADLGFAIRRLRQDRRLSQEELADLSRVHVTLVGRIERGERDAQVTTLMRLADGLGVSLSTVMEVSERRPWARPPGS